MKILVVDDEVLARERLLRLLAELAPDADCLQAASGEDAVALVQDGAPDLVLLDIRMPGMDGIEVAEALDRLPQPPAIIFCTAYDEYALQALQRHAVAYLLKPVRGADLARALQGAGRVNRMQLATLRGGEPEVRERRQVSAHTHRGLETMPLEDIRCFLAEQKYVTACSPGRNLVLQDTLKELEQEFGDAFVRVHRNALVALQHVVRLQRDDSAGWLVQLEGVEEAPAISRRHLAEVKQRLLQA